MVGALVAALAVVVGGCASETATESGEPFVAAPRPTIGLGSDVGGISGGADLRQVDVGEIRSVVMIGDSITVGATPYLEESLDDLGFDDVVINAMVGKRMGVGSGSNAAGSDVAAFIAGALEGPDDETLWIVALGTNDAGAYSSDDAIRAAVDTVLEPVPVDAPVVWINTYIEGRSDETERVNEVIESTLARRGNATIGRWDDVASVDGVLSGDGVHPNDDGSKVFAELVIATVENFLG